MFFNSFVKLFDDNYSFFSNYGFDKVDPNIVKYFRTEYGKDWKNALQHHLYKESIKKDKKAA